MEGTFYNPNEELLKKKKKNYLKPLSKFYKQDEQLRRNISYLRCLFTTFHCLQIKPARPDRRVGVARQFYHQP